MKPAGSTILHCWRVNNVRWSPFGYPGTAIDIDFSMWICGYRLTHKQQLQAWKWTISTYQLQRFVSSKLFVIGLWWLPVLFCRWTWSFVERQQSLCSPLCVAVNSLQWLAVSSRLLLWCLCVQHNVHWRNVHRLRYWYLLGRWIKHVMLTDAEIFLCLFVWYSSHSSSCDLRFRICWVFVQAAECICCQQPFRWD